MLALILATNFAPTLQDAKTVYKTASSAVVRVESSDSVGTGFAIQSGRLVVTCYHVIDADILSPSRITVNGARIQALLEWSSDPDIAILLIKDPLPNSLQVRTTALDLGEKAFCVGYPLGLREQAISEGIVSSLRPGLLTTYVQTSVPISSGSSGSPLLDESARVIGVIESTLKQGQQNNLAISARSFGPIVRRAIERLENGDWKKPAQLAAPTSSKASATPPFTNSKPTLGAQIAERAVSMSGLDFSRDAASIQKNSGGGFVAQVFEQLNLKIPSDAKRQSEVGKQITRLEDLSKGDRLYFWDVKSKAIGWSGIYLGQGYFVRYAPGSKKIETAYLNDNFLNVLVAARRS